MLKYLSPSFGCDYISTNLFLFPVGENIFAPTMPRPDKLRDTHHTPHTHTTHTHTTHAHTTHAHTTHTHTPHTRTPHMHTHARAHTHHTHAHHSHAHTTHAPHHTTHTHTTHTRTYARAHIPHTHTHTHTGCSVAVQQYIYSMKAAHSYCTCYLWYCHLLNVFTHNHITLKAKTATYSIKLQPMKA